MKLAEALIERADTQRYISQLKERLNTNATHQEGIEPVEKPELLLKELSAAIKRLQELIAAINRTNMQCCVDGRTLTDMLAERDAKTLEIKCLRSFVEAASEIENRYSRSEIRKMSSVNVSELRKTINEKAKYLRQLDTCIQSTNWVTDII